MMIREEESVVLAARGEGREAALSYTRAAVEITHLPQAVGRSN